VYAFSGNLSLYCCVTLFNLQINYQWYECDAYTLSQKNDTDVAHYNFNTHQLILAIFGRDVAE